MASLIQTQLTANALLREHGLAVAGWTFRWDHARRRGGACHWQTRHISMSKHLVPLWSEEEVRQTLLHECAHALAGPGAGHGPKWRQIAESIGFTREKSTHDNPTVQGRYVAVCDTCGGKELYRAHRFTAAMRQGRHLHRVCMKPVRWVDTAALVR